MKRIVLIIAVIAALGLTSSCTKDDTSIQNTQQNGEGNGGEGGDESGIKWNKDQTADETLNGIHAIIHFDTATETFVGTFENTNSTMAPKTRLEVHVFDAAGNSTEFGPTPSVDMQAGETRNVSLPITPGTSFTQYSMHPEVGTSEGGGGK